MDNKTSLRALPNNAYARKFVFIFMTICSLFLCSNVFAADYIFNGETVPATSTRNDSFFGVETVMNILEALDYPYNDITKVSTTYYINEYMEYYKNNIDETVKAINVCFLRNTSSPTNSSSIYILVGNGTFSDTLPYLYTAPAANQKFAKFNGWNYNTNGSISSENTSNMDYGIVTKNSMQYYNSTISYNGRVTQTNANILNYNWLVAPIKTYTVASRTSETGYSYYFLENTYEFSESSESGDISGDNSGDNSGTDLTMTNELINKINAQVEEINKKIPTSGDIQQATIAGVTSGLTDYFGGSGDANFEDKQYTSGEVLEKIDFKPIENPNANFWLELTNILNNALTGSSGQIVFKWFGNEYTITPNQIVPPYPSELQILLTTVSTVVVILIIAKWIKIIADTSQEGNLDQLLEMNEEGIVNLF